MDGLGQVYKQTTSCTTPVSVHNYWQHLLFHNKWQLMSHGQLAVSEMRLLAPTLTVTVKAWVSVMGGEGRVKFHDQRVLLTVPVVQGT